MTQPEAIDKRLDAGDDAAGFGGGLSINETHAVLLGVVIGALAAEADSPRIALATVVASLIGEREGRAIGLRTLRREPWYFAIGVLVGYACRRVFGDK